MYLFPASWQC